MNPLPHVVHHLSWWWNENCTPSELKTVLNITAYCLDKHALDMQSITAVEELLPLIFTKVCKANLR